MPWNSLVRQRWKCINYQRIILYLQVMVQMDWPELPVFIKHPSMLTNSLSACWDVKNWWAVPNPHYHEAA